MAKYMRSAMAGLAILALAVVALVAAPVQSASAATLSQVGPTLSENSTQATAQVQTLLRHDQGVHQFLGLKAKAAATITVTKAKAIKCVIGTKLCPFNTGKAGWRLKKTSFRWGNLRPAYRVSFTMNKNKKVYSLTVHKLSSNLLSHLKTTKITKPKRVKVTRKAIVVRLIAVADASAAAGNNAEITCPAGSVARAKASASSSASASAGARVKILKVKAGRAAWKGFLKKATVFASAGAAADASATVECVPVSQPPPPPPVTNVCPPGTEGPYPNCKNKNGEEGAGDDNAGSPINAQPGAGDSGTAPSADCYALDGNNDPTIPGRWNSTTRTCERV